MYDDILGPDQQDMEVEDCDSLEVCDCCMDQGKDCANCVYNPQIYTYYPDIEKSSEFHAFYNKMMKACKIPLHITKTTLKVRKRRQLKTRWTLECAEELKKHGIKV